MTFKQQVVEQYKKVASEKVQMLQQRLADLIENTNNETKSSAGDKHETARAMLQIEQDNTRRQLQEAIDQKVALESIDYNIKATGVIKGSIVTTNRGVLFVSVALGKATVNGVNVISLSPQSPLGKKLIGLRAGDAAKMNEVEYIIEEIN